MAKFLAAITALCLASPAAATPVYLTCQIQRAQEPFKVTLDEAAGTATYQDASHTVRTAAALFSADKVSWTQNMGIFLIDAMIDRRTLEIGTVGHDGLLRGHAPITERGTCKIEAQSDRQF